MGALSVLGEPRPIVTTLVVPCFVLACRFDPYRETKDRHAGITEGKEMSINKMLGKLSIYQDEKCVRCGYQGAPPGELNIEGRIHHRSPISCLDP